MNNKTILLVEDNPDDETLTTRALQKSGFPHELVVARDGVEALDYLFCTGKYTDRPKNEQPRMVLLDLKLPRIDGLELLRRLRADELTRKLPVVVFTSSSEENDILTCYSIGVNSFVRKPVDFVHFNCAVRCIAEYWLTINLGA